MANLHPLPPPSVISMVLGRGALVLWLLVACRQWGAPAGTGTQGHQWGKDISFPRSLHAESWNWPCRSQACLSRQSSVSAAVVTSPSHLSLNFPIPHTFFFFFWPHCTAYEIFVPRLGINPRPQQWKQRILTTGPPGNTPLSLCNPSPL